MDGRIELTELNAGGFQFGSGDGILRSKTLKGEKKEVSGMKDVSRLNENAPDAKTGNTDWT